MDGGWELPEDDPLRLLICYPSVAGATPLFLFRSFFFCLMELTRSRTPAVERTAVLLLTAGFLLTYSLFSFFFIWTDLGSADAPR